MQSKDTVSRWDEGATRPQEAFDLYQARMQGWTDGCCTAKFGKYLCALTAGTVAFNEIRELAFTTAQSSAVVLSGIGFYALHKIDQFAYRKMIAHGSLAQFALDQSRSNSTEQ